MALTDERINMKEIRKEIKKETVKDRYRKKKTKPALVSLCDSCHIFGCSYHESNLIWLAYSESHYSFIHYHFI